MVQSAAPTVDAYLAELPPERRDAVARVRDVVRKNIPALAAQKNYFSLYLHSIYADPEERKWFERAYGDSGHKLDAGKSCVRFKRLDDLPLDVIADAVSRVSVEDYIERYEASRRR